MGDTKQCTKCGQVKLVGEFARRAESADQLTAACKTCLKAEKQRYYAALRSRTEAELEAARPRCKRCFDCGATRDSTDFARDKNKRDGLSPRCKPCAVSVSRQWRADQDPDTLRLQRRESYRKNYPTTRAYRLLKNFNLTTQQFDAMLAAQGGCCAICHKPETGLGRYGEPKSLAVDHDRACCPGDRSCGNCVRDLLCQGCNPGIGQFDHDPARLRAAADYLEKHTWQKPLDHTA